MLQLISSTTITKQIDFHTRSEIHERVSNLSMATAESESSQTRLRPSTYEDRARSDREGWINEAINQAMMAMGVIYAGRIAAAPNSWPSHGLGLRSNETNI